MESVTVSIIILSYNGWEHLETCLNSLAQLAFPQSQLEIIVVDNASSDGSAELVASRFPHVRLIRSETNLGFSQGVNLAARAASGEYLALLNNDMRVEPSWLKELVETLLADEQLALAGSAILDWDGTAIDFAGRSDDAFCLNSDPNRLRSVAIPDHTQYAFFVSAGAALVRATAFWEIGGFDPDYFMYHEDVDLCWRFWLRGYKCALSPKSITYHRSGASSGKLPTSYVQGLAQKHTLFTLFKNLEAANLKELLPLVFYVLLERGRWIEAASVSIEGAVQEFQSALQHLLAKRAEVQRTRVSSDAEIFSQAGHPLDFLLRQEDYQTIKRQLTAHCPEIEVDLNSGSAAAARDLVTEWLNAAHFLFERNLIAALRHESVILAEHRDELAWIKNSRGWRLYTFYGRVKHGYLLPIHRWLGLPFRYQPSSNKPE